MRYIPWPLMYLLPFIVAVKALVMDVPMFEVKAEMNLTIIGSSIWLTEAIAIPIPTSCKESS